MINKHRSRRLYSSPGAPGPLVVTLVTPPPHFSTILIHSSLFRLLLACSIRKELLYFLDNIQNSISFNNFISIWYKVNRRETRKKSEFWWHITAFFHPVHLRARVIADKNVTVKLCRVRPSFPSQRLLFSELPLLEKPRLSSKLFTECTIQKRLAVSLREQD